MRIFFLTFAFALLAQMPFALGKSVNLKLGVIPFFARGGHFEIDLGVGEKWALGVGLLSVRAEVTDANFYGPLVVTPTILSLRGTFFSNGVFSSGFYLSPSLQVASVRATGLSQLERPITATATATSVQAIAGYHWFGEHFNFAVGAGANSALATSQLEIDDGVTRWKQDLPRASGVGFAFEVLFGWVF